MQAFVIIISLVVGIAYAYLLYSKSNPWLAWINWSLFIFRTLVVAILVWLLLSPEIKNTKSIEEKPIVAIAIDNSVSTKPFLDNSNFKQKLNSLTDKIKSKNFDVKIYDLTAQNIKTNIDSLKFNKKKTNISQMLVGIENENENQHLKTIVLFSDGIINEGFSPLYQNFKSNIISIGIGDSVVKKDLSIAQIDYNKYVNKNAKFPIKITIKKTGFKQVGSILTIKKGETKIEELPINFSPNEKQKDITIYSESAQEDYISYNFELKKIDEEVTYLNNVRNIYLETLKSQKKILVYAHAPHPDLRIINELISENKEYEVEINILGINEISQTKPDLVIFHQIPSSSTNFQNLVAEYKKNNIPQWYIIGNQSNLIQTNATLNGFKIMTNGQLDKVQPSFSSGFDKFIIPEELISRLADFPPIMVPFGEYNAASWEYVLVQKVGTVLTNKPLWAVNTSNNDSFQACTVADGLWQWSMIEKASFGNALLLQNLFQKTVQLLLSNKDKKKFQISPIKQEFDISETVSFQSESKNDIDEYVVGNEINLNLTHSSGKKLSYTFVNTGNALVFETTGLKEGRYNFIAKTNINKKEEIAKGIFLVIDTDIENINHTADFQILRQLSDKNNGSFYMQSKIEEIAKDKLFENAQSKLHAEESFFAPIEIKWIIFVAILLLFFEWAARKYFGSI